MRIAITTSILRVPPSYFVVEHARSLAEVHEFRAFALAAEVNDPAVCVPVTDSLGLARLPIATRMKLGPLAMARLGRQIRAFKPDLIHQHFATWSGPAISSSHRLSAPLITTLHGYDVFAATRASHHPLAVWHRHNIAQSRQHSTRLLAVSEYLAGEAIDRGFPADRLFVHYQGVDTNYFTPGDDQSTELPIVLFVGGLAALKGPFDVIRASRAIQASSPHRLVMIGTGPLQAELSRQTTTDSHIALLGSLPRSKVREWMRRASVTVLPTQVGQGGAREAAGLVLLESQSCGTPVVAYPSGGTPEMMLDGQTGTLTEERNIPALGSSIRDFLTLGDSERRSVAAQCREFVVSSRSTTVSSAELELHYRSV